MISVTEIIDGMSAMLLKTVGVTIFVLVSGMLPALASDIVIVDAYARASGPSAKAGAAFMIIENMGQSSDRLIGVSSEVAMRTELHTHVETDDGVMQMRHVEDGLIVPAGGQLTLQRGGNHVMFMGLFQGFEHGESLTVVLTFEEAGDLEAEIPIDLER
jgi:copper(I)-binding protein